MNMRGIVNLGEIVDVLSQHRGLVCATDLEVDEKNGLRIVLEVPHQDTHSLLELYSALLYVRDMGVLRALAQHYALSADELAAFVRGKAR